MKSITHNKPRQRIHCKDCGRRLRDPNDEDVMMKCCLDCFKWYEVEREHEHT